MGQPQRWSDLFDLFEQLIEAPAARRDAILAKTRRRDAALADQLTAMLASHEDTRGLLDAPLRDLDGEAWTREQTGRQLGPYVLDSPLGEGGMGVVFAARQLEPIERRVAIKLVKLGMDTAEVLRRFRLEQDALARMEHPHIARVLDAGTTPEGSPYFVMELVDGVAIDRYCDDGRLSLAQRLALLVDVCRAVQHAHQKGIIHRDLKPANVMVSEEDGRPVPKIIDFGIAKAMDAHDADKTGAGRVVGTPEYMSPEQRIAGADIDTRADIYGLGALLFTLVSGARPGMGTDDTTGDHTAASPSRLLPSTALAAQSSSEARETAAQRSTTPAALAAGLRGDLDWITRKATAARPDDRYSAASDVADDLQAHLENRPVAAGPPSVSYRMRKFLRRNRGAVAAGTLVFAALAAFAAGLIVQSRQVQRALVAAEHARQDTTRELARTQRVTQLLVDLFEGADPVAAGGAVTTTTAALEHGLERLRVQLADEPELRVELLHRLAQVFRNLGLYGRAQELLQEAIELRRGLTGGQDLQLLPLLLSLSETRRLNGQYDLALESSTGALELVEGSAEASALDRASAVLDLGGVHLYAARYREAEPLIREGLQIRTAKLAPGHLDIGEAQNNLGVVMGRLGEYEESEQLLLGAIANARAHLPAKEASLATRTMNLSLTLRRAGRFEEALTTSLEALEIRQRVFGASHPETAVTLENHAQVLNETGRSEEALELFEQVVSIHRQGRSGDPRLATALSNLGIALRRVGRSEDAVAAYRESVAIRESAGTADGADGAAVTHNLAVALSQLGRSEEALGYSRQAVERFRAAYGNDNVMVSIGLMRLARLSCVTGNRTGSEEQFAEATRIQDLALPADHWRVAVRHISHGQCLLEAGSYSRAESELLDGLSVAEAALGPDHQNTRRARALLATLYEETDRPDAAARYR